MTETRTFVVGSTSNVSSSSRSVPPLTLAEKPENLFGIDFKWWQQNMFFYLTTLTLQKFIKEDVLVLPESTPENERFMVTKAWKHSDFLCKNYILSGLEGDLYNVYSNVKTSKELWEALEKKYKTEDAGLKKFVATKFLDYKMVYSKPVITQVQELQVIIHDLLAEGIIRINAYVESINSLTNYEFFVKGLVINEAFQVAAMIEKLPPLWRDFKNYLKHKRKEMGANIVETTPTNPKKRNKSSGPNNYPSKKKFKENCHNCGKVGHKPAECRAPKKEKKKDQANMVQTNDGIDDLCAMLSECNLVENPKEWWIDSGSTRHVCVVREAFASYAPAGLDETIFMGNSATTKTEGYGKIFLKMTSSKVVTLNNVCHVPEI
ncbi:uncharacterized protein LOC142168031 [Nicotiana tabacum]|uniref:Uncharacterized protein LOC142168031 n=1 Tax=Nicotiana tabacum TaxID=4097 RepID=A0AC58SII0_TOBAC